MNSKIIQALKSRTIWTMIIMLVFNLLPQLNLSPELKDLINGVLTLVAAYFKMNPNFVTAPAGSVVTQTTPTTVTVTTPTGVLPPVPQP